MIEKPFEAYEGDQPYYFVSYAHADHELVYGEMAWLHDAGVNLWYDDGIHIGANWRRELATALDQSHGVLFFCTSRAGVSDNCLREINFALDHGKPIFVVHLDDTDLPIELQLSLSDRQALRRSAHSLAAYRAKLLDALGISAAAVGESNRRRQETQIPTIGILPVETHGLSEVYRHVCFAAMENIVGRLRHALWSVMLLRGEPHTLNPANLASRYDLSYLVSQSVIHMGSRFRITTRLTDAVTLRESESVEIETAVTEPAKLLADIEGHNWQIVRMMEIAEQKRFDGTPLDDLDGYGLMYAAREADRAERIRQFERALEQDPGFAHSWSQLAQDYWGGRISGEPGFGEEEGRLALEYCRKGLELNETDEFIRMIACTVELSFGKPAKALAIAEPFRAYRSLASSTYYDVLLANGKSRAVIEHARANPLAHKRSIGEAWVLERDLQQAADAFQARVKEEPRGVDAWLGLANVYALTGRDDSARRILEGIRSEAPGWTVERYIARQQRRWGKAFPRVSGLYEGLPKIPLD